MYTAFSLSITFELSNLTYLIHIPFQNLAFQLRHGIYGCRRMIWNMFLLLVPFSTILVYLSLLPVTTLAQILAEVTQCT